MSARFAASLAALCAVVGLCGGCDRMPWSQEEPSEATAASATTAAPAVPQRPVVAPTDVVAKVNDVSISKADVELRIQELKTLMEANGQAWTPLTSEQLGAVLEELINTELMSQDAEARGVDRPTPTQQRWEYIRRGFYAQEWLRWHQDRHGIEDVEVQQYYETNKPGFRQPEQRRLRQLVISSEAQAKQTLSQLLGGAAEFIALTQQVSQGPTAANGGLLANWVMRTNDKALLYADETEAEAAGVTSLDPALEAAAFAIDQVNGLSSYVKGADGRYHIFQLVERQAERQRPFEELQEDIRSFLLVQKLQQAVDELIRKAAVERFPERLEGVAR